jgi:hypothetical protein
MNSNNSLAGVGQATFLPINTKKNTKIENTTPERHDMQTPHVHANYSDGSGSADGDASGGGNSPRKEQGH